MLPISIDSGHKFVRPVNCHDVRRSGRLLLGHGGFEILRNSWNICDVIVVQNALKSRRSGVLRSLHESSKKRTLLHS